MIFRVDLKLYHWQVSGIHTLPLCLVELGFRYVDQRRGEPAETSEQERTEQQTQACTTIHFWDSKRKHIAWTPQFDANSVDAQRIGFRNVTTFRTSPSSKRILR